MDSTGRRTRHGWQWGVTAVAAAAAVTLPLAAASSINAEGAPPDIGVIVQEFAGTGQGPENAVARLGGSVTREIPLIHGFSAKLPATALAALRGTRGVRAVTEDRRVALSTPIDGWDPDTDAGSLQNIADITGASQFWRHGETGRGVDVAVIDSGVSPVEGLDDRDKLVYGPDLVVRVPAGQHALPRHVRARHAHGGHHRRPRLGRVAPPLQAAPPARVRRHRAGRPDRVREGCGPGWGCRCLPGDRGHRLGGPAPPERWPEHPRPQPLLRHRRRAGLPHRPAHLRGRGRLAEGHRRGRLRRQRRVRQRQAQQPGVRPLRHRRRRERPEGHDRAAPTTRCPPGRAPATVSATRTSSRPASRS